MDIKFLIKKSSVSIAITVLLQLPIISPVLAGVDVTVSGNTYNISTIVDTYTSQEATLQSQIWWGNPTLAASFASAVSGSLGYPYDVGQYGPMFIYGYQSFCMMGMCFGNTNTYAALNPVFYLGGGIQDVGFNSDYSYTYAIVNLVPASTNILSSSTNLLSAVSVTLNPVFDGGTLIVDSAATTSTPFTITSNNGTINQNGFASRFSGVFSDAITGTPGSITIANTGSGGSVTFSNSNTYTGSTTINSGATGLPRFQ